MGWLTDLGRGIGSVASDAWDSVSDPGGHAQKRVNQWSGVNDTAAAEARQQQFLQQGMASLGNMYGQAQGMLSPYMQGGAQNFQDMQGLVRGGAFSPQFQQYQGPTMAGNQFQPSYSAFSGQTHAGNQFTPQYQGYQGPMQSQNNNPQFQGPMGGMFSYNVNPQYSAYQGPMSSGAKAPQYQQFQGQTQFNAQARPDRMAGTTANVGMYSDPGYQFRLNEGLNAVQSRLAGRGLIGSGAEQKGLMDYAQGAASQEFGAAHGRMMTDQANRQADFESDRGFGMANTNQNFQNAYRVNQDANAWNAQNADRTQRNFEGDRAFGFQVSQAPNAFNQQNADRTQSSFEGDRSAALQLSGMQNAFGQQNADRTQGAFEGDRAAGLQNNQFANNFNLQAGQMGLGAFNQDRAFNYGMNQDFNAFNQQNADRGLLGFNQDRAFGYGMNQDQNAWNRQAGLDRYGMWNNMVNTGMGAAQTGANLASNYGQSLADMYTGMGNAAAASGMAQGNQRRGLIGDMWGMGGMLFGG